MTENEFDELADAVFIALSGPDRSQRHESGNLAGRPTSHYHFPANGLHFLNSPRNFA